MRRRHLRRGLTLLVLGLLPGLLGGCVTSKRVRAEVEQVTKKVERAKKSGAVKCAPKELAYAESHSEFALYELDQGDFVRAAEHSEIALKQADLALKKSQGCAPKRVLIKHKKKADRDGDGVHDEVDRCPDHPGPAEHDGCPDTDGDGLIDVEDRCPKKPGPVEEQGCPDTDGDGLNDADDQCPLQPGPKDNEGCPVGDTDGDGLPDNEDKCPLDAEDPDGFEDEDGCPDRDNDKDGVLDAADKCPLDPGPPESHGCPVQDRDGDGIVDSEDKCPDLPGPPDLQGCPDRDADTVIDPEDKCPDEPGAVEEQGCPKKYSLIVVTEKKIELKQKIHFATGKARIMRDSYELLNQVADALRTAGKVKIRIEGHTDSDGGAAYNLKLSQRRADSVKNYLSKQGVERDRMEAVGFGESSPIASNMTRKGKAMNRRVEFNITK